MLQKKWKKDNIKNQQLKIDLPNGGDYIYQLICKYHDYFSKQDRKYRGLVRIIKVTILFLAMISTIILGLKTVVNIDWQIIIGLILSSLITFITGVSSYFNFEEYWMRNITIHIKLNIMRNNFEYEAKANILNDERVEYYKEELNKVQYENIKYWEKAIKRI